MKLRHRADPGFVDRRDAGRRLAGFLAERDWSDPVVLGLARGGVPVAREVADELGAPLDVAVARKIGAPGRRELGVGATTASGPATYDRRMLAALGLTPRDLEETCEREQAEARRREVLYQTGRDVVPTRGRDVIVVDDGLATGVTATAALRAIRTENPRTLVFAAPVCAPGASAALESEADEILCLAEPEAFRSVGQWYADFGQTSDDEVIALLRRT